MLIGGTVAYSLYTDNLLCGLGDGILSFKSPPCDLPSSYVMPAIAMAIGALLVAFGFKFEKDNAV